MTGSGGAGGSADTSGRSGSGSGTAAASVAPMPRGGGDSSGVIAVDIGVVVQEGVDDVPPHSSFLAR